MHGNEAPMVITNLVAPSCMTATQRQTIAIKRWRYTERARSLFHKCMSTIECTRSANTSRYGYIPSVHSLSERIPSATATKALLMLDLAPVQRIRPRMGICIHPLRKCRNMLGRIPAKMLVHTLFPSINESDLPQQLAKLLCTQMHLTITNSARTNLALD